MGDTTYNAPYNSYGTSNSTYGAYGSASQNNLPQLGKSSGPKVLPQPLLGESYDAYPTGRLQWDNRGIVLTPGRTVAPVGSQVIITAGVVAPDNYLSMNERVEWSLTSGSVGQFVEVEPDTWTDLFLLDFTFPRKISPLEAVTSTSRNSLNLNRGTPTKTDDIKVRRGETWIAVSSPVEGTSYITAFAPSVYGWHARERTAMIHWIDAEWQFPAPSFGPAGGHQTLKTKLARHSDHRPLVGWRVRYTVTGGPAAGFTPDGSKVTEVVTNQNGEAIVELAEEQAVAGTNQVSIEIVRPDGVGIGGVCNVEESAITVGKGATMVTWSAPELSLTKTGPMAVGVGTTVTYQINVTNPGDLPTDDVQIVDQIPLGAEYIDSTPPAQQMGASLQWKIGRLEPRETRTVQVRVRATQSGNLSSSAEATAIGGLTARGSVTTQVGSPKLDVRIQSRSSTVQVGDTAAFDIYIYNISQVAATNLTIVDNFDEGLIFEEDPAAMQSHEIKQSLNDIQPGKVSLVKVNFKTTRPGRFNHKVTVIDGSGSSTSVQGFVVVTPAPEQDTHTGSPDPPILDDYRPGSTADSQPIPGGRPYVQIEKTGSPQVEIGKEALFTIKVKNVGETELTNLVIIDNYDNPLKAKEGPKESVKAANRNSISWKLPSLAPGVQKEYSILCEAGGPAGRVRNQATVTTDQRVQDTSDAYINIVEPVGTGGVGLPSNPPPVGLTQRGNLTLRIDDDRDPAPSDKQFNYEIAVTNKGTFPDQNVVLIVEVSPELTPKKIGTRGRSEATITAKKIEFVTIPEIQPNETLRYWVRVKANSTGMAKAWATVSSRGVPKLEASDTTEVISSP